MQYDAAIIGAGPAGATFARRLAQQSPELKILLLDAQDEGDEDEADAGEEPAASSDDTGDITIPMNVEREA